MKSQKSIVKKKTSSYATTKFSTKFDNRGRRMMICINSEPGSNYWKGHECHEWTLVGDDATAVVCFKCTSALTDAPVVKVAQIKSDKPKGWKFMKVFVDKDGSVYHKGIEQPELKGQFPVTVIEDKPEKKKLSKQEKENAIQELGKEIEKLKVAVIHETRKGKKAELTRALSKANKALKKLT
jgi:hypothetical protein